MTNDPTAAPEAASSQDGEQKATESVDTPPAGEPEATQASESETGSGSGSGSETETETKKKKTRRRRRGGRSTTSESAAQETPSAETSEEDASTEEMSETKKTTPKSKKKSAKKTTNKTTKKTDQAKNDDDSDGESDEESTKKTKKKSSSGSSRYRRQDRLAIEVTPIGPMCEAGERTMVIDSDYTEECRIAFLENDILEEFFQERRATATSVGNIYKGRVVNVEAAIQAAFVDYGQSQNGFLHVSDLHPRYFPGGEKTERVGRKTPRRERPPIQDALKKGQEILVQVLKQGVGTKGPTLTSYLSLPGRLLVMMPDMDRVGVSRKVEDDEQRREMRRVLDELNLPEGFGFILRTAGFEHSKTDLKRDVAYLQRLWKQMEKRMNSVGAPAELYTEGDLLVRSIRDLVDASIGRIITNDRKTFQTTRTFLSIVAPRSSPPVFFYDGDVPLFEKFGIEKQVDQIHSRQVTLKSGGALVIDQAEALVAIDVNSGRSRSARDSETNAYTTNCEAVDELARQLRLRDLGGLVICDLIDMRMAKNRKAIEERLAENLRRDRARTTFLPISEFGIVEMTRQRMRPSMRSLHFSPCNSCKGIGELRSADSIGADAIRRAAWLLALDSVRRVEIVCSSRSASSLLSTYRRRLDQIERPSNKRVDVRISDTIGLDDFNVYAYDERNADIDISRLPRPKASADEELLDELPEIEDKDSDSESPTRGRRRRRRKPAVADAAAVAFSGGFDIDEDEDDDPTEESNVQANVQKDVQEDVQEDDQEDAEADTPSEGGKKRRRRRRRRRKRGGSEGVSESGEATAEDVEPVRVHILAKELDVPSKDLLELCQKQLELDVKTHMSSIPAEAVDRLRSLVAGTVTPLPEESVGGGAEVTEEDTAPKKKRRRRRRRRGRRGSGGSDSDSDQNTVEGNASTPVAAPETDMDAESNTETESATESPTSQPAKGRRRSLYGSQRRKVSPAAADHEDDR